MKPSSILLFLFLLLTISCGEKVNTVDPNTPTPVGQTFSKASDIKWASPNGFDLTMDIYTPNTNKTSYPVIVIFHGGGWLINNKSIMNQMSEYLAKKAEYVVCNVNYRLLGDLGNTVTMNEIIEDSFGAVLWIKDNISKYKGDASKIIVTGDSAGGHLAAMIATQGQNLETDGFKGTTLGFNPTYLPNGKTAETIAKENGLTVQAAMVSYGVFDVYGSSLTGLEKESNFFWGLGNVKPRGIFGNTINPSDNPNYYKQVSPIYNIPTKDKKVPPMLLTVGSNDNLTTPATVQSYIAKLTEGGHTNTQFWVHTGRPHAFLDSGTNTGLGISFEKDAIPALDIMITFLNKIFY